MQGTVGGLKPTWQAKEAHVVRPNKIRPWDPVPTGSLFMVQVKTAFVLCAYYPCLPPNARYLVIRGCGHGWEEPPGLGGFQHQPQRG